MPTPEETPPIAAPLGDVRTARLDLRRFDQGDLDELAAVFANPEVWEFPYGRAFSREETEQFIERQIGHWNDVGFGLWVARTASDGRIVGYVGLAVPTFLPEVLPAVEVGWRFTPEVWGNGYASEGAAAALDEAFSTLGLARVCSIPQADNPTSVRVAERLGLELVQQVELPANELRGAVTALVYEITKDEWRRRRSVRAAR